MQFERCWYIHTHICSYIQTLRSHYHKQDSEHIYAAPSASSCLCIFPPSSFPAHSHSLTTTNLLSVIIGQFAFFRVLCKWNHTVHTPFLSVFFWLTIIILRFILLVACINISFLFIVEQCFIVWIYHICLDICCWWHLSCFQIKLLWTLLYKSICGHIFPFFSEWMLGLCGRCMFNVLRNCQTIFQFFHFPFLPTVYESSSSCTRSILLATRSIFS